MISRQHGRDRCNWFISRIVIFFQVLLKKNEYNIRMYRVAGAEKLLQKQLRDEDGQAIKLHVAQRLALLSSTEILL